MGCGGSKQDVATANTVSCRLQHKKSENDIIKSIKDKPETDVSCEGQKPEEEPKTGLVLLEAKKVTVKEARNENKSGIENGEQLVFTDVKDIIINGEANDGGSVEEGKDKADDEAGKLISRESPDRYFSSRKEGTVEIVACEGVENHSARFASLDNLCTPPEEIKSAQERQGNISDNECLQLKEPIVVKEANGVAGLEESKNLGVKETNKDILDGNVGKVFHDKLKAAS